MKTQNATHDNLPQMVELLFEKIQELKLLVNESARFKSEPSTSDRVLKIDDVMQLLGCKKATIYSKTSKGEIPHMKAGGKLYFSEKEIMNYLQNGKVLSHSEAMQIAKTFTNN